MYVICEGFTCPKDGASETQNDDAYIPRQFTEINAPMFRCAVADGATESLYAGKWAQRIAQAFQRGRLSHKDRDRQLPRLQGSWARFLKSQQLPWYAESKAESGSFATLLGLELHGRSDPAGGAARWIATALGDSCLFLVRNDALETALPITAPDGFDNSPHLLASNPKLNIHFADWLVTQEGDLHPRDQFYLMTDALSSWFLRECAAGNRPWHILRDVGTDAAPPFTEWISSLRACDDRMNDDATLLRVEIVSVE